MSVKGTGNPDEVGTFSREQGTGVRHRVAGEPPGLPRRSFAPGWALASLLPLFQSATAQACSVCYGDPDSSLTKGALSGVWVLGGFVYTLLMGLVGTAFYWRYRARHFSGLAAQPDGESAGSGSMRSSA